MLIYHKQIDLDEGFEILDEPKQSRLVQGRPVSPPSGLSLYKAMRAADQPLKCWNCGIEANCFISNKGRNDLVGPPVLDLFADTGTDVVMMTRDHIIPKSYGGVNDNANLRVGCSPCNHGRGNNVNAEDRVFMNEHPELIVPGFVLQAPKPELTDKQRANRAARQKAKRKILNAKRKTAREARAADATRIARRAERIAAKINELEST